MLGLKSWAVACLAGPKGLQGPKEARRTAEGSLRARAALPVRTGARAGAE